MTSISLSFRAVLLVAVLLAAPAPSAQAGYVTGIGTARTAHLFDSSNGLEVTVAVPETFEGYKGATYNFTLQGSSSTVAMDYLFAFVLNPDISDARTEWNISGRGATGATKTTLTLSIPAEVIQGRQENAPVELVLAHATGAPIDTARLSIDLLYRAPPPDGGLLQLAIASTLFWGIVFLYAGYLSISQRKLNARAEALERSLHARTKEVPSRGEEH